MSGKKKKLVLSDAAEDAGGPHWLSPAGKHNPQARQEIRDRHRKQYEADLKAGRAKVKLKGE